MRDVGYQVVVILRRVLTCFRPCARIPFDPRSGIWIGSTSWFGQAISDQHVLRVSTQSRAKEFNTSQEPNGRTREEGSDVAASPPL
jgi:hypothetical protein